MGSYDGFSFQFKEISVEDDEPDKQFLLVVSPYIGVHRFNVNIMISR